MVWLEQTLLTLFGNALPIVLHLNYERTRSLADPQDDGAAWLGELARIGYQVGDYLGYTTPVGRDFGQGSRNINGQ